MNRITCLRGLDNLKNDRAMKGIISKGESLKFEFDVNEVTFNGKFNTAIRITDGRYSKALLTKLRSAGVIDKWAEYSWGIDVNVNTNEIWWED